MRFLVDAQLPPDLARWLVSQGHEAEHVEARRLHRAGDHAVWSYAESVGAVIVTKDEDFLILRLLAGGAGPKIVWIRRGNTRRVELLRWFEAMLPTVLEALGRGETLIEIE